MRKAVLQFFWMAGAMLIASFLLPSTGASQELKLASLGDLKLESGEVLKDCRLGYRTLGQLNSDRSNAILFPTWFTGKSGDLVHFVGADKMLDPDQYFVILVDAFGNGVSSSPSNSPAQPKEKFPHIAIRDMVHAEYLLATKELGLKHLHSVMGISMGGLQTFQWAVSYPEFMDVAIPIVGSPQLGSYDLLLWNAEASSIEQHLKTGDEANALNEAAMIHNLNLSTPAAFSRNTKRESYSKTMEQDEKELRAKMNAYDFLCQLRAMIGHDVSPAGGTVEDAAKRVKARMLVVVARQDLMVNPLAAMHFAELKKAPLLVLESDCGHLATGCQGDLLATAVRGALTQK